MIVVILLAGVYFWYSWENTNTLANIDTFEDCVSLGFPIMETLPRQCRTPDGRIYFEKIDNKQDFIQVQSPSPNAEIVSPVTVKGKARGSWYFEASFPAKIVDANGEILAQVPVQAKGEWMTTDFVPFEEKITFKTPTAPTGEIILEKDNPSGLPGNADEVRIPVTFKNFINTDGNAENTMEIMVYFSNSNLVKATEEECTRAFPVTRKIPKTQSVAKASIEELLKGPTPGEKTAGYMTSIPVGSKLNSISIVSGVAKADFNSTTESGGGSCSMAMRTAQIRQTLLQFQTIKSVELSINGRMGDIFQP